MKWSFVYKCKYVSIYFHKYSTYTKEIPSFILLLKTLLEKVQQETRLLHVVKKESYNGCNSISDYVNGAC